MKFYTVIFFSSVIIVNSQDPRVSSKIGEIVGNEIILPVDSPYKTVHQYSGIPFAKPPVGDLRFRKPEPVTSLTSPFYAQKFSAICPQRPIFETTLKDPQDEDCLYLNVYVPDRESEIPDGHAVLIWVYGGGFQEGSANTYDFSLMSLTGNIIVVTFNYRVGVFGFLSTGDENARGNYGLWDQHMAFQWVHDNIGDFGGNTERVTIAGESAGAMSVIQHALVPANKGLFQRVIAQSGSMSMPAMDLGKDTSKDVHTLAEGVGCNTDNIHDVIECLRVTKVDEILAQPVMFNPVFDGELIKINTRDITKIAKTRSLEEVEFFRSLDILSGFNANEGVSVLPWIMSMLPKEMQVSQLEDFSFDHFRWTDDIVPAVLTFSFLKRFSKEILQLVDAQYRSWSSPYDQHLLRLQFEKLVGDLTYAIPAIEMAHLHAMSSSSSENNFMYHFLPKPSTRALPTPSWISGAGHADELMFMGAYGMLDVGVENAWENDLMTKMMTYWTNFVKSGNPNYPTPIEPAWQKYDIVGGGYQILNATMPSDMPGPRYFYAEETNFWLHVFPDLVDAVHGKGGDCGDGTWTSAASNLSLHWAVPFVLSICLCIIS
ncbi:cholinesterase 2-like [Ruditapes philippinarum]|uniref:cholinesterase 2-like n=1 Tax=Ruditapes philippinarum TaxID=129788 RepID=UPI00295C3528|nr:cholinesterase 2-like [Ruditapes philippinarum]